MNEEKNEEKAESSAIQKRTPAREEKIRRVLGFRQPSLTIVMENVDDPHNVSAVFRSCDAVGVLSVCLVYPEKNFPGLGERSSASARKWVETRKFISIEECFATLRAEGNAIFTTQLGKDSRSLYDLNLTERVALVFGNEHSGVSEEAVRLADGNFLIPQVGMIQSLNISVACAVSLFEAFRQRNAAKMYDEPQLPPEIMSEKIDKWLTL